MAGLFLAGTQENPALNQYWFSQRTLESLSQEVVNSFLVGTKIACISTPSLYFSLSPEHRAHATILDIDESFTGRSNFQFFDFNHPEHLPAHLSGFFDLAVIDPPFITREVWEKYSCAAKQVLKTEGKLIVSSIAENAVMLYELLGVSAVRFQPSIPHLVYQYSFYTNYACSVLMASNPELET